MSTRNQNCSLNVIYELEDGLLLEVFEYEEMILCLLKLSFTSVKNGKVSLKPEHFKFIEHMKILFFWCLLSKFDHFSLVDFESTKKLKHLPPVE